MSRAPTPPTPERRPDWEFPVAGSKVVRRLGDFVRGLRERQAHGLRRVFLDDVFVAHLLAFFNPVMRSLRKLEDFSQTRQASRHLTVPKLSRTTLSDYHRLADAERLTPLLDALRGQLERGLPNDVTRPDGRPAEGDLLALLRRVEIRDGTFLAVAADVAWAITKRRSAGRGAGSGKGAGNAAAKGRQVRIDVSLHAGSWIPEVVAVHGAECSESDQAAAAVRPGAIYVHDRGVFSFELIERQLAAKADFVHRLRAPGERTPRLIPDADGDRELGEDDRRAGVIADRLGGLAGSSHRAAPKGTLREIVISLPGEPESEIRLLTSLLDPPAWVIAMLYRWRWQIELFFRWLKVYAGFDHLLSHSRRGAQVAVYTAVIGTLLICLECGGRPSTHAFSLLSLVAQGRASLEEIAPILRERERQSALDRAGKARRAAAKKKS